MTPRPPGDLLPTVAQLTKASDHGWSVHELPRVVQRDLHSLLDSCRAYVARDPHGALHIEALLDRLDSCVDDGRLGLISSGDLRRLASWLRALPTTVRGAA